MCPGPLPLDFLHLIPKKVVFVYHFGRGIVRTELENGPEIKVAV